MSPVNSLTKAEEQKAKVDEVVDKINARGGCYLATKRIDEHDLKGAVAQLNASGMRDLGQQLDDIIATP